MAELAALQECSGKHHLHVVPHVDFQTVLEGDVVNARAEHGRAVLVPADYEDVLVPWAGLLHERRRRGQKGGQKD